MDIKRLDIESLGQGRIVTKVNALAKVMLKRLYAEAIISTQAKADYAFNNSDKWDNDTVTFRRPTSAAFKKPHKMDFING